jgi:hypothetical protein
MCLSVVIFNWSTQNIRAGVRYCRPIIPRYIDCDLVYPGGFIKRDVKLLFLQHCLFCTEYKPNKVDELLDGAWSLMWFLWKQSGTEGRSLPNRELSSFLAIIFPGSKFRFNRNLLYWEHSNILIKNFNLQASFW